MISFVIPTLNEEKIIEKILKNLSDYKGEKEIIISDGRSTDRTIELVKKYTDKIVIHDGKTRQTIGGGRNAGAAVAQGEYVVFLDADMFIPNVDTFIQKAVSNFEKDKKLVAQTVYIRVFPEMENWADRVVYWFFNRMIFAYNNIVHYGASSGEFQMIHKDVFDKVSGFDERLVAGEDFDMFARLSKVGKTRCESSLVVHHTGRRAHKVGWPKLLWSWFRNWIDAAFFKRSKIKEWTVIR